MNHTLKINMNKFIQCRDCGKTLDDGSAFFGGVYEHANRVYSFTCERCEHDGGAA